MQIKDAIQWWEDKKKEVKKEAGGKLKKWEQGYRVIEWLSAQNFDDPEIKTKYIEIFTLLASNKEIKKEFKNAARAVQKATHEEVNASTQGSFCIAVALGIFKGKTNLAQRTMERVAVGRNGDNIPITYLAQWQRLATVEFLTKPFVISKNDEIFTKAKMEDKDTGKAALAGHTGAAFFRKFSVVREEASPRGGIHAAQIKAQQSSSHHLTFSRRLSKKMDKYQIKGEVILEFFEKCGGFASNSNWKGFAIADNPRAALAVALKVEHNYKKRQTIEKKLREAYETHDSDSEEYDEISNESETDSKHEKPFIEINIQKPVFKNFMDKHKIQFPSNSLSSKIDELNKCLSRA